MKKQRTPSKLSITLIFSIVIFISSTLSIAITAVVTYLLIKNGFILSAESVAHHPSKIIIYMSILSLAIGSVISYFICKIPLSPVKRLVNSMKQLAGGNFKVRLKSEGILNSYPAYEEVIDNFNKMAEELEKIEFLRSDFINNFSHEFKTPIVSIAGFAQLLKRGNLSDEQKREYIDIIEEESLRLSRMATNVLNLTKVENQNILTDTSYFNLSEQIRSSVLLLEKKWSKKKLDLILDFAEYTITANEELLKQVWINLIDNAVKFTPDGGTVEINIFSDDNNIRVKITNTGSEIPPENIDKIFNKFYQADESHSSEGNGIGLAIVKRVVDLHCGKISVKSENGLTSFVVELPVRFEI